MAGWIHFDGLTTVSGLCYNRSMRERLKKRLPEATEEHLDGYMRVIDQYGLDLTIKNLDAQGLVLWDTKGRSVRVTFGEWRNKTVHVPPPESDIAIVITGGIIGGWIESEKLEFLEDRCIVDLNILHPLPTDFCFDQYCSHLVEHGGFYEGEFWECFGCGKELVFNDHR